MRCGRWRLALVIGFLAIVVGRAAPSAPPSQPPAALSDFAASLGPSFRALMLQFVPTPLYEDHKHWGMQKEVETIKWMGQGLKVHPEKVKELKNHGVWKKVVVQTPMLSQSLVCEVRNLVASEPGKMTFSLLLAFDTAIDYDRQRWDKGVRLWSGNVKARMKVMLTLNCEVQSRVEASDKLVPDMVLRLRVVSSDLQYDNLVVTHVPGLGGDAAQILGDAVHNAVKKLKPSLERKLLDKGNAAIVKAADSKEIRISFMKLLGGK
jgi:hypothetical protein